MVKKGLLMVVLAAIVAGGAFAQFSLRGEVSTDFSTGVNPSLGIGISLDKLDILAGFSVGIAQVTVAYDTSDNRTGYDKQNYTTEQNTVGIYAGIAPKATHEKWTVSVPMLASVYFGEQGKLTFDDSDMQKASTSAQPANSIFGFAFMVGGRGEYAFSEHWSIYTGFLWNVIKWEQLQSRSFKRVTDTTTLITTNGSERLDTTRETVQVFNSGVLQLGVSYKF